MNSLAGILTRSADQYGERLALVDEQRTVNYRDLANAVAAFAETLEEKVRPGDRAAIFLPNGIEFVRSFFAIARLGGVVVPLNDQYKEIELTRLLNEGIFASIITSRLNASLLDRVAGSAARSCRIVFVEDYPWDTAPAGRNPPESRLDAPVLQQFSSGSTGNPKRICRTHRNLLFELDSLAQTLVLSPQDRFLGVTPFSHVNGLVRSMMASLYAGATLHPLARFQREAVVEMIERQRLSVFIGVPFMFGVLAKSRFSRPPDFSSLRLCVSASAPMPLKLNREFHDAFGIHVRQLYGSTETGTISVDLSSELEQSLRSVGKPLPGVEVNIYNDKGVHAEISEIGEIAVKSRAAIARYEEEDELNRSVFKDGFFLTGDLGFKDEDGRVYLVGRKKLFINKGGYKINPREVEDLLELHPKVEEAVVIGVPTTFQDERVKATLVVNASCTAQEILEHCRGKIADFKVPSLVEFRERLPKTATGKIRRDLLLREETSGEVEERV